MEKETAFYFCLLRKFVVEWDKHPKYLSLFILHHLEDILDITCIQLSRGAAQSVLTQIKPRSLSLRAYRPYFPAIKSASVGIKPELLIELHLSQAKFQCTKAASPVFYFQRNSLYFRTLYLTLTYLCHALVLTRGDEYCKGIWSHACPN